MPKPPQRSSNGSDQEIYHQIDKRSPWTVLSDKPVGFCPMNPTGGGFLQLLDRSVWSCGHDGQLFRPRPLPAATNTGAATNSCPAPRVSDAGKVSATLSASDYSTPPRGKAFNMPPSPNTMNSNAASPPAWSEPTSPRAKLPPLTRPTAAPSLRSASERSSGRLYSVHEDARPAVNRGDSRSILPVH